MRRRPQRDRLVTHLLGALVRELHGQVDLTALERRGACLILEDLPLDGVDRRPPAPVGRVRLERVPGGTAVLLQLNGPVPFIFDVQSPGFVRSAGSLYVFGRMIAW